MQLEVSTYSPTPHVNPYQLTRFDIILGHYLYYSHYHRGMWSREYKRLSRIQRYFEPTDADMDIEAPGNEGARYVYEQLVDRFTLVN